MNPARVALLLRQMGEACFELADEFGDALPAPPVPANETEPRRRRPRPLSAAKIDGLQVSETDRQAGNTAARSRGILKRGARS